MQAIKARLGAEDAERATAVDYVSGRALAGVDRAFLAAPVLPKEKEGLVRSL